LADVLESKNVRMVPNGETERWKNATETMAVEMVRR
jgi:hypothetical protein